MGQMPLDEGADEDGVHFLGTEDVQQLAEVGGLFLLIADVDAFEAHGLQPPYSMISSSRAPWSAAPR